MNAYVLMTALPPTTGHLELIRFASNLASRAHVILCTQPDEPYWEERLLALQKATRSLENVVLHHIHKGLPQEPEQTPAFWDMWADFLHMFGFQEGDYIAASEIYGIRLAEEVRGVFMPYDMDRSINGAKATVVRNSPSSYWDYILPEFRSYVQQTVTIFGAESVGKTTMAKQLSSWGTGQFIFEWARPYLETVGSELTTSKMEKIWHGQAALQRSAKALLDRPVIIQDTDLYSTVGYWQMFDKLSMPRNLNREAEELKSDLYIVPASNVEFVPDPLRYGGDKREGDDAYWLSILDNAGLPYEYIQSVDYIDRIIRASDTITKHCIKSVNLHYDRVTKESLGV